MKHTRTTSSHQRYRAFVNDYRQRRIDDADKTEHQSINPVASREVIVDKRRKYLNAYWQWLRPHRYSITVLIFLACISASVQMITPLFMRFIVDHVLLNTEIEMVGSTYDSQLSRHAAFDISDPL